MKFKVEANDGSGWAGNALIFNSHAEATAYAIDLMNRWLSCRDVRVIEHFDGVEEEEETEILRELQDEEAGEPSVDPGDLRDDGIGCLICGKPTVVEFEDEIYCADHAPYLDEESRND